MSPLGKHFETLLYIFITNGLYPEFYRINNTDRCHLSTVSTNLGFTLSVHTDDNTRRLQRTWRDTTTKGSYTSELYREREFPEY